MKRLFAAALAAFCLLALSACASLERKGTSIAPPTAVSSPASTPAASSGASAPSSADPVAQTLASMTLEEKVGQLFFGRCPAESAVEDVSDYHLGGYLLFGRDFKDKTADEIIQTIAAYQDAARQAGGIPLLIGTDEEGGSVVRVSSNPALCREKYRSPQQLFADGGLDEIVRETMEKDRLLRALGVNVNLAPVCDVSTDPDDFIYPRTLGQDAASTAEYISAVIAQTNSDGIGSVLKHFPGYGNNADTHTGIAIDSRPLSTFESSDFLPFQSGISSSDGKTAVLVSHNIMTAVDASLPASLSPKVHALVRDKLGFSGVVMTDDLAMDAVKAYEEDGSAAVLALLAGNDLLITTDYRTQFPLVLAAVKDGTLSQSTIDAACTRVLTWKHSLGLL
jgi:Beta-glucosidase-related glycosidases